MKEVKTGQTKHEVQNNDDINYLGQCKMACVLPPYLPWQLSNTMTFFAFRVKKLRINQGLPCLRLKNK